MPSLTPLAQTAGPQLVPDAERALSPAMRRILALLQSRSPLSAKEISQHAFVAAKTLEGGGYLKKMKAMGLIRVEGWAKNHNGFTTPIYAAGAGPDCPRPKFQTRDRDSVGMARIVAALEGSANLGYRDIAELAGLSTNTIKNGGYMDVLMKQGRVHISAWRRNRKGGQTPLYSAGPGANAVKPPLLTRQEIMSRYRERQRVLSGRAISLEGQFKAMLCAR
ncbi:hypothetical protein [Azonexus hydrophilus]|uniref:hypothetical protein n=1 Tax=Azonexus hydrophilus TaxID=418702 RepID=UPI0012F77A4A|nr:hypothetical protein [Azonexus hydrophilus]